MGEIERTGGGGGTEVDHHEEVLHIGLPDAEPPSVLEGALPLLRPHGFPGGDVAQVGGVYPGQRTLADPHGDGEHRDPGGGVAGTVDGVEDEDLVETVVDVSNLLREDVQGDRVADYVVEDGVLGHLVDL